MTAQQMRPIDDHDDVDALRDHIKRFLDAEPPGHCIMMARPKLEELIFWLRSHRNRMLTADAAEAP